MNIQYLGSPYGGYHIDLDKVAKSSVVYDFGVGMDVSFAVELFKRTKCQAHLFDPTPKVKEYVLSCKDAWLKGHFYECGVGAKDEMMPFYHHKESTFITHSVQPGGSWLETPAATVPIKQMETIMKWLGHTEIAYCKLNLGGDYEYNVILDMLESNVLPRQLAFIWIHMARAKYDTLIGRLTDNGYKPTRIDDHKKVTLLCR